MIISLVILLCFAVSLCALTTLVQAEEQKIDWIRLTVEQKWSRAIYNSELSILCGIAYAKSLGKTPEDFGKFMGDLVGQKWEGVEGVVEFVRKMQRNWQIFNAFEMEVLSESDVMFKAKVKGIFAEARAKKWSAPGVTADECIRFYEQLLKQMTNHIGLNWEQEQEGDWVVISITEKNRRSQ